MKHNYQVHTITNMDTGLLTSETPSGVTTTVYHFWDGNVCMPKAWYIIDANESDVEKIIDLRYTTTARQGHGSAPIRCNECGHITSEEMEWQDGKGLCPHCDRYQHFSVPREFFFQTK